MSDTKVPILQFDTKKAQDLPFEIFQIEETLHGNHVPTLFRQTFYIVVVLTGGDGITRIDFKSYPIKSGGIYFITPGQIQSWDVSQPLSGFVILFDESFLPTDSLDLITPRTFDYFHRTDLAPVLFLDDNTSELTRLCHNMLKGYTTINFGRQSLLQSYLRIFLILAQRLFAEQRTGAPTSVGGLLVDNFIRLIDVHYLQIHRVSQYAEMLGVTSGHLTDISQEQLGIPASHVIQRRILLEAKRLLTYSDKNVGEIAFSLNFTDPSYFARYFRKKTGQSPTTFRTKIREKYPDFHTNS